MQPRYGNRRFTVQARGATTRILGTESLGRGVVLLVKVRMTMLVVELHDLRGGNPLSTDQAMLAIQVPVRDVKDGTISMLGNKSLY